LLSVVVTVKGTQELDKTFPFFSRDPFQAGGKPEVSTAWRMRCFGWKRSIKGKRKLRYLTLGVLDTHGSEGKPVSAARPPQGKQLGKPLWKEKGPQSVLGCSNSVVR